MSLTLRVELTGQDWSPSEDRAPVKLVVNGIPLELHTRRESGGRTFRSHYFIVATVTEIRVAPSGQDRAWREVRLTLDPREGEALVRDWPTLEIAAGESPSLHVAAPDRFEV